jgi:phosphopantothenoylcysteine decarboxylase/phosphopantothenate--cysteine ligase
MPRIGGTSGWDLGQSARFTSGRTLQEQERAAWTPTLLVSGILGGRAHPGSRAASRPYKALDLPRGSRRPGARSRPRSRPRPALSPPLYLPGPGRPPRVYRRWSGPRRGAGGAFGLLEPAGLGRCCWSSPRPRANNPGKLANGLADDMLPARPWLPGDSSWWPGHEPEPVGAPATRENMDACAGRGVVLRGPVGGEVDCGGTGQGAVGQETEEILAPACGPLAQDLAGRKVLRVPGPHREHWDPVRFWSNASPGSWARTLAVVRLLRRGRGHAVVRTRGPAPAEGIGASTWARPGRCSRPAPASGGHGYGLHDAAVADFRPEPFGDKKFRRTPCRSDGLSIRSWPTGLLWTWASTKRTDQTLNRLRAETQALGPQARKKLHGQEPGLVVARQRGQARQRLRGVETRVRSGFCKGSPGTWPSLPMTEVGLARMGSLLQL